MIFLNIYSLNQKKNYKLQIFYLTFAQKKLVKKNEIYKKNNLENFEWRRNRRDGTITT